jgi:hypothetical protein
MTDAELLRQSVDRLSDKVDGLSANVRRSRIATWILAALCVVTLVVVGVVIGQARFASSQATCVRSWANAYAARTSVLVPTAIARNDALDNMIRTLALPDDQRKASFDAAFVLYLKASDAYTRAAAQNPPPTAPQYTC